MTVSYGCVCVSYNGCVTVVGIALYPGRMEERRLGETAVPTADSMYKPRRCRGWAADESAGRGRSARREPACLRSAAGLPRHPETTVTLTSRHPLSTSDHTLQCPHSDCLAHFSVFPYPYPRDVTVFLTSRTLQWLMFP